MTEIKTFDRRSHPPGLAVDRWHSREGWDHRRWVWPAPAGRPVAGSMIFQAGRGDFFEKYLESLNAWHEMGWNLTGFDWRGQAGSGRLLNNPSVGHIEGFEGWVADLDEFVGQWRSEMPGPHVVAGHSMGGHLVMRYIVDHRPGLDGCLLSAPMLKMISRPLPERIAYFVARQFNRFGFSEDHAWQENERPSLPGSSRQKLLTHDYERYSDEGWWEDRNPELKMGPPSWRWLVSAYASADAMFAPGTFEEVKTPVLIVAARKDKLVSIEAIREAADRIPGARLVEHPTAAHELLREVDDVRDPLMNEIAQFLRSRAGAVS